MISSRPDVDDADIKEMRHKLAMAALESRRGAAWSVEKIVAVGRKPSLARHE